MPDEVFVIADTTTILFDPWRLHRGHVGGERLARRNSRAAQESMRHDSVAAAAVRRNLVPLKQAAFGRRVDPFARGTFGKPGFAGHRSPRSVRPRSYTVGVFRASVFSIGSTGVGEQLSGVHFIECQEIEVAMFDKPLGRFAVSQCGGQHHDRFTVVHVGPSSLLHAPHCVDHRTWNDAFASADNDVHECLLAQPSTQYATLLQHTFAELQIPGYRRLRGPIEDA